MIQVIREMLKERLDTEIHTSERSHYHLPMVDPKDGVYILKGSHYHLPVVDQKDGVYIQMHK